MSTLNFPADRGSASDFFARPAPQPMQPRYGCIGPGGIIETARTPRAAVLAAVAETDAHPLTVSRLNY